MPRLKLPTPVTASWSTLLPQGYASIGISRGPPRRQRGYRLYRPLAPGPWFNALTPGQFRRRYLAQLGKLDPEAVLREIVELAEGKVPVLQCFEEPPPDPAWCHRGLVSVWLADTLGIKVREYGHASGGWGWNHPKLPLEWQARENA